MRQELKKKKGIKEEIQLTTKQKEMMQIQMEKESATRKRLQEVRSSKVCPVNQVIKTECPQCDILKFAVCSWMESCRVWWVSWKPL